MSDQDRWRQLAEELGLDPAPASPRKTEAAPPSRPTLPPVVAKEPDEDRPAAADEAEPEAAVEATDETASAPDGKKRRRRRRGRGKERPAEGEGAAAPTLAVDTRRPEPLSVAPVGDPESPVMEDVEANEEVCEEEETDEGGRRRRRRRRGRKPGETPAPRAAEAEVEEEENNEEEVVEINPESEEEDDDEDLEESMRDLSNWNVPNWQEIIAGLYRPPDR